MKFKIRIGKEVFTVKHYAVTEFNNMYRKNGISQRGVILYTRKNNLEMQIFIDIKKWVDLKNIWYREEIHAYVKNIPKGVYLVKEINSFINQIKFSKLYEHAR